jgi:hypothetical protein
MKAITFRSIVIVLQWCFLICACSDRNRVSGQFLNLMALAVREKPQREVNRISLREIGEMDRQEEEIFQFLQKARADGRGKRN